ncbi:hypothetical protein [Pradoshia sp.]
MKVYKLKRPFHEFRKGTEFYLIAQSEFIGVKEFTLRTKDLNHTLFVNEREFLHYFMYMKP